MLNAWHVRPAKPADAEAIVALLNEVYGDWGTLADWHWKYQQPPTQFRLPSAVADMDGQIIGHFGIVPLQAVLNGKRMRGAQTVDAAVLTAYRRRGIHSALGRYVLDQAAQAGVTWIYAFPGLFSLAVDQRMGYRPVAFVPEMVRVLQARRALSRVIRLLPRDLYTLGRGRGETSWSPAGIRRLVRLRRTLLFVASWISDPVLARSAGRRTTEVVEQDLAEGFDARFDALWQGVRDHTCLSVCKDARYLTWRYHLNPGGGYRLFLARDGRKLVGLLIMRHTGLGSDIAELLALPDRVDAVSDLLATAIVRARRAGSVILTAWSPARHPYHASLRRAGFVSQRRLHWLAERWPALARWFYRVIDYARHLPLDQQDQLAACIKMGSLTMGDSDLV